MNVQCECECECELLLLVYGLLQSNESKQNTIQQNIWMRTKIPWLLMTLYYFQCSVMAMPGRGDTVSQLN